MADRNRTNRSHSVRGGTGEAADRATDETTDRVSCRKTCSVGDCCRLAGNCSPSLAARARMRLHNGASLLLRSTKARAWPSSGPAATGCPNRQSRWRSKYARITASGRWPVRQGRRVSTCTGFSPVAIPAKCAVERQPNYGGSVKRKCARRIRPQTPSGRGLWPGPGFHGRPPVLPCRRPGSENPVCDGKSADHP